MGQEGDDRKIAAYCNIAVEAGTAVRELQLSKTEFSVIWLGEQDSNLHNQIQNLVSYRWTISHPLARKKNESRHVRLSRQPQFIYLI